MITGVCKLLDRSRNRRALEENHVWYTCTGVGWTDATRRQKQLGKPPWPSAPPGYGVITGKHCTRVSTSGSIRRLLALAYRTEIHSKPRRTVSASTILEGL